MGLTMYIPSPNPSRIMASCKIGEPPNSVHTFSSGPVALSRPVDGTIDSISSPNISNKSIHSVPVPPRVKTLDGTRSRDTSLATMWREIHGSNNWDGLVEPLSPLLREEIVRYGELIAACYRAFNLNPSSDRYLHCKYGRQSMLRQAGVVNSGYEITRYVYATPSFNLVPTNSSSNNNNNDETRTRTASATPSCSSRWLGYVAVSSDEEVERLGRRDVAIVFRGTVTNPEWVANFMSSLTPARLDPLDERPHVRVESGFLNLYTSEDKKGRFGIRSCREQLLSEVSKIIRKYKDEEMSITIAGHSMGGAIALLLAYDIAELGLNRYRSSPKKNTVIPIAVHSFGGPRVGNCGFRERCEELGIKVLRVANVRDPITKLPGIVFNENLNFLNVFGRNAWWRSSCYTHVGVELALDFLSMQKPCSVHDLDTYIGFLKNPGRRGEGWGFDAMEMARKSLLSVKSLETWQWISLVF